MKIILWGMALGLSVVAAGTDIVCKRVPNELIILGIITGAYLWVSGVQSGGILTFLWRLIWPVLLLYILYLLGGLGAGDIKLIGCLSLYLPGTSIIFIMMCSCIIGGLIGFLRCISTGQLLYRCIDFLRHVQGCLSNRQLSAYIPKKTDHLFDLHFAAYIFISAVVCFLKEEII